MVHSSKNQRAMPPNTFHTYVGMPTQSETTHPSVAAHPRAD